MSECVGENIRMVKTDILVNIYPCVANCCHVLLGPTIFLFNHSMQRTNCVSQRITIGSFNCSSDRMCCKLGWGPTRSTFHARGLPRRQPSLAYYASHLAVLCLSSQMIHFIVIKISYAGEFIFIDNMQTVYILIII